jgi:hypothetical protein
MRRRNRAPLTGAAAELAGYAAEYQAAAVLGDQEAAERLRAVLSWMDMLHIAGDDSQIGELFLAFARDDRVLSRLRRGTA